MEITEARIDDGDIVFTVLRSLPGVDGVMFEMTLSIPLTELFSVDGGEVRVTDDELIVDPGDGEPEKMPLSELEDLFQSEED